MSDLQDLNDLYDLNDLNDVADLNDANNLNTFTDGSSHQVHFGSSQDVILTDGSKANVSDSGHVVKLPTNGTELPKEVSPLEVKK